MSATYAQNTSVSVEKTRAEIEMTLKRYGATSFGYATEDERAVIMFKIGARWIRFILTLPDPKAREFTHHSRGARTVAASLEQWEQACRSRWRALGLVIKAKLEAVAAGITTVEDEFLAATVMPDGQTVGAWAKEPLDEAYRVGQMPSPLLAITGPQ